MPCPFSLSLLRFPRLRVERCLFSARRLRLGEEPLRSPHMATRWASTTPVFALSRLFRNICALPQCPGGERCGILACLPACRPACRPTYLPAGREQRSHLPPLPRPTSNLGRNCISFIHGHREIGPFRSAEAAHRGIFDLYPITVPVFRTTS